MNQEYARKAKLSTKMYEVMLNYMKDSKLPPEEAFDDIAFSIALAFAGFSERIVPPEDYQIFIDGLIESIQTYYSEGLKELKRVVQNS